MWKLIRQAASPPVFGGDAAVIWPKQYYFLSQSTQMASPWRRNHVFSLVDCIRRDICTMAHITTAVTMLASPPQIRLSRKLPGLPSLLPLVLAMANQLWHRINGKKQGITSPDKAIDCRAFHAVPLSGGQYHR